MIVERLKRMVVAALQSAEVDGVVASSDVEVELERPKRREHGDWATNVALVAARGAGDPRAVAQAIVERLPPSDVVERVDIAGPGFLNFHLSPAWLHDVVRRAAAEAEEFGRSNAGAGVSMNVEYVSSNPTGPINVVSGRHAAVGDAIANLLEAVGHRITREFYANDAGRQIDLFAESVAARYMEIFGEPAVIPEGGYTGAYVKDIARSIQNRAGDAYRDLPSDQRAEAMRVSALEMMREQMQATLARFGTRYDVWFSERSMHEAGKVGDAVALLRARGFVEDREGAQWFPATRFGDDKDRVLVRSNGVPTYLAADTAYLIDKLGRGFDLLIYLWGADHHGTVRRLKAVAQALGYDPARVEIMLVQMVTIGGLRGSKRMGIISLLDELMDEVGRDATRYTFLTRSIDAPLDFDLDLVKSQAPENPVYYVQYAHARISSILRRADDQQLKVDAASAPLELLQHSSEEVLMRKLASYEEVVPEAAAFRAPQRITRFVEELASDFSSFYRDCRVVSDDTDLTSARLALCVASRNVIADALGILGVSAPERM
jgi:arginyl-tRNA synthetase